jgi:hypothetical protein
MVCGPENHFSLSTAMGDRRHRHPGNAHRKPGFRPHDTTHMPIFIQNAFSSTFTTLVRPLLALLMNC